MDKDTMLDRCEGCVVGGAVGDALGYPVEFMSYRSIRATYGEGGIRSYQLSGADGTALFSDDTQMTLFTAAGLIAAGRNASWAQYARHLHRSYLDWLRTQDQPYREGKGTTWLLDEPQLYSLRAPGNTCLSALRSRRMGLMEKPLNNSCGCGGVMRVAPIGLYLADPDDALQVGAIAAAITHGHPMGFIPAAALAYIVNRLTWGEEASLSEVVGACAERLPEWFEDFRPSARDMGAQLSRASELAANGEKDADNIALLGEGWVGDEALAIAVYAALRHEGDFSQTVIAAVNHGGDSDSTGAIAGNIAGAQLGASRIGHEWTCALELPGALRRVARELCFD